MDKSTERAGEGAVRFIEDSNASSTVFLMAKTSDRVIMWLQEQIKNAPPAVRLKKLRLPPLVIAALESEMGIIPPGHVLEILGAVVESSLRAGPYWVCSEGNKTVYGEKHPSHCHVRHLGSCDWRGPFYGDGFDAYRHSFTHHA